MALLSSIPDVYTDLSALLGAGTWTNYHATAPKIWKYNLKSMDDLGDFVKAQKEGLVISQLASEPLTTGTGKYIAERQSAKVLGFSSNNGTIRDNLLKDLIDIVAGDGSYVFLKVKKYDESRGHTFLVTLRRIR